MHSNIRKQVAEIIKAEATKVRTYTMIIPPDILLDEQKMLQLLAVFGDDIRSIKIINNAEFANALSKPPQYQAS